MINNLEDKVI